jgi:hypothetical protein
VSRGSGARLAAARSASGAIVLDHTPALALEHGGIVDGGAQQPEPQHERFLRQHPSVALALRELLLDPRRARSALERDEVSVAVEEGAHRIAKRERLAVALELGSGREIRLGVRSGLGVERKSRGGRGRIRCERGRWHGRARTIPQREPGAARDQQDRGERKRRRDPPHPLPSLGGGSRVH